MVPGYLQTPGCATALPSRASAAPPNDVSGAVEARMHRSHVIHEGDHRFATLIEENVLHHCVKNANELRRFAPPGRGCVSLPG